MPPAFFRDRTLHLSQAWPVRLEAPFLRAVAASEAFGSYSMCRSCRECFGGMGGPASSSTGRFTGMAGLESRCDGSGRRRLLLLQYPGWSQSALGGELLAWAGKFRLSCARARSREGARIRSIGRRVARRARVVGEARRGGIQGCWRLEPLSRGLVTERV
jgi:hypothetical protein